MSGFFKVMRSESARELLRDPNAFALLAQIAYRAKWSTALSVHNLKPGQAMIGDHRSIGLSEKEYRGAKRRLEKYNLAAFHGANKGTVATLLNTDVFDIFGNGKGEQEGSQRADRGRTEGDPRATNEEGKTGKTGKKLKPSGAVGLGKGMDYATAELPAIEVSEDVFGCADPIVAAVGLTKERQKRGWGYWLKILNRARKTLGTEKAERMFLECVDETRAVADAGECDRSPKGAVLNRRLEKHFPEIVKALKRERLLKRGAEVVT